MNLSGSSKREGDRHIFESCDISLKNTPTSLTHWHAVSPDLNCYVRMLWFCKALCHAVAYAITENDGCLHLLVPPFPQYLLHALYHKFLRIKQQLHSKGGGLVFKSGPSQVITVLISELLPSESCMYIAIIWMGFIFYSGRLKLPPDLSFLPFFFRVSQCFSPSSSLLVLPSSFPSSPLLPSHCSSLRN